MTTVPKSNSSEMRELLELSQRIASTNSTLLLEGETGTGKEWLAHRIHKASPFADGPFVPVHCGAIPEGLVESTLFGHVKGAFTGAVRSARGHFETASGGTIFLDEIGEISPAVQVKLLRVLQDHQFYPVGNEHSIEVNLRVMAATNRNLKDLVGRGLFRSDLYYRLAVITLKVPPLRERIEDLPLLVDEFVEEIAARAGREPPRISQSAIELLKSHPWDGNIRELINVLERGVLLSTSEVLRPEDFSLVLESTRFGGTEGASDRQSAMLDPTEGGNGLKESGATPKEGDQVPTMDFKQGRKLAIARFEEQYLTSVLRSTNGHIKEAVRVSGIRPRTLYTLMRKHGLRKETFKKQ